MFAFHHQGKFMLFSVKLFIEMPTLSSLTALERSDLLVLANHYKLETTSEIRKNIIQIVYIEYLIDEEIVSEDKIMVAETTSAVVLKKLELQKRGNGEKASYA